MKLKSYKCFRAITIVILIASGLLIFSGKYFQENFQTNEQYKNAILLLQAGTFLMILEFIYAIYYFIVRRRTDEGAAFDIHINHQAFIPLDPFLKEISDQNCRMVQEYDPTFSEQLFVREAKKLLLAILEAYNNLDATTLEPYETVTLFQEHQKDIQEQKLEPRKWYYDQIVLRHCYLDTYSRNEYNEALSITIQVQYVKQVRDTVTNKVIDGSTSQFVDTTHTLVFSRPILNFDTDASHTSTNCPNCGAPLPDNKIQNKCPYCSTNIYQSPCTWLLCKHQMNDPISFF